MEADKTWLAERFIAPFAEILFRGCGRQNPCIIQA